MRVKKRSGHPKARGAALIVALLVVALVAVIATSMASDYIVTVKRASNQLLSEQAYSYLRGAEAFAVKMLRLDMQLDSQNGTAKDDCNEFWAQETPPMMLEEGAYGGRVQDLQGRFNINNLQYALNGKLAPNDVHQARFIRLILSFDELELTPDDARAITEAVSDWLDADRNPEGYGGAEDGYYENIDGRRPHRAANRSMVDISELLLVANMPPKLYQALLPHVTVWPLTGGDININTATLNVLQALNVPPSKNTADPSQDLSGLPVSREDMENVLATQLLGFSDVAALANEPVYKGIDQTGLSVSSNYFMLNGEAVIGGLMTRLYSVISRKDGIVRVIQRSTSGNPVIKSCVPPEPDDE
jgi:general secretion pathway protein K